MLMATKNRNLHKKYVYDTQAAIFQSAGLIFTRTYSGVDLTNTGNEMEMLHAFQIDALNH